MLQNESREIHIPLRRAHSKIGTIVFLWKMFILIMKLNETQLFEIKLKASSVFEVQSTDSSPVYGSPVLKPSAKTSKVSSWSTNICQKEGANRF